jgi:hypothetical protein
MTRGIHLAAPILSHVTYDHILPTNKFFFCGKMRPLWTEKLAWFFLATALVLHSACNSGLQSCKFAGIVLIGAQVVVEENPSPQLSDYDAFLASIDELIDLDLAAEARTPVDSVDQVETPKPPPTNNSDQEKVVVADYFESLSVSELQEVCRKCGFDIVPDDTSLSHADYVSAARKCVQLEEEVNAVLAQHPELAAELDAEIERMLKKKTKLEEERRQLLAEKEALERQLKALSSPQDQSDVVGDLNTAPPKPIVCVSGENIEDSSTINEAETKENPLAEATATEEDNAISGAYYPDTFPDIFIISLQELYGRVRRDIRIVMSLLRPIYRVVLKPVITPLTAIIDRHVWQPFYQEHETQIQLYQQKLSTAIRQIQNTTVTKYEELRLSSKPLRERIHLQVQDLWKRATAAA